MIYNQRQRQLIIWEQKDAMNIVRSVSLLLSLGLRIWMRDASQRVFKYATNRERSSQILFANEQQIAQ